MKLTSQSRLPFLFILDYEDCFRVDKRVPQMPHAQIISTEFNYKEDLDVAIIT